jgi:hypothetical protein
LFVCFTVALIISLIVSHYLPSPSLPSCHSGISLCCPGWPQTCDSPASASWVPKIIGAHHHAWVLINFWFLNY